MKTNVMAGLSIGFLAAIIISGASLAVTRAPAAESVLGAPTFCRLWRCPLKHEQQ